MNVENREDIPQIRETKRTIRVPVHIGNGSFDTVSLPKILPESGLFRLVQEYISNSYTPEWVYIPVERIRLHFNIDKN